MKSLLTALCLTLSAGLSASDEYSLGLMTGSRGMGIVTVTGRTYGVWAATTGEIVNTTPTKLWSHMTGGTALPGNNVTTERHHAIGLHSRVGMQWLIGAGVYISRYDYDATSNLFYINNQRYETHLKQRNVRIDGALTMRYLVHPHVALQGLAASDKWHVGAAIVW